MAVEMMFFRTFKYFSIITSYLFHWIDNVRNCGKRKVYDHRTIEELSTNLNWRKKEKQLEIQ